MLTRTLSLLSSTFRRCLDRGPEGLDESLREWRVYDTLPETCDMILLVAHGFTTDDEPTKGTIETYQLALGIQTIFENRGCKTEVYFGSFEGSPNEESEKDWKHAIIPEGIYTGTLRSTVEEVWKAMMAWRDRHHGHMPRRVIYITDEAHSRRAKIVADKFFGRGVVRIISIPLWRVMDPKSAMATYSGKIWDAFVMQAKWEPAFRILPAWALKRLMRLGQPIAKK